MSDPRPDALPVHVEAVEWLPTGSDSGLLRVRGRFAAGRPAGAPVLVIGEHRHLSLPEALSGDPAAWRGAFVVGARLLAPAPERIWVEWRDGLRADVPVPPGVEPPAVAEPEPSPGGEVVDRAVLAERRARRAEAAEQAQARIAREALKAVEALERRGREVEDQLEDALREHDVLQARIARLQDEVAAGAAATEQLAAAEAARDALATELAARPDPARLEAALAAAARLRAEATRLRLALRVSETGRAAADVRLVAERPAPDRSRSLAAALAASEARGEALQREVADVLRAFDDARDRLRRQVPPREDTPVEPRAEPEPLPPPVPAGLAERARAQEEAAAAATAPAPDRLRADLEAAAGRLKGPTIVGADAPPARAHVTGRSAREYPRLRGSVVKLAHDDPVAAARLLVGLLPAAHAVLAEPVDFDLTLREAGTFAVTVGAGRTFVAPGEPRHEAQLHVRTDAVGLAEALAGERTRVGRWFGRTRASGSRGALASLQAAAAQAPDLAAVVQAGARIDPESALRTLAYLVPPAWTKGHAFAVRCVVEDRSATVVAANGAPLDVRTQTVPAIAAITMSAATWERLLAGERPELEMTGNRAAAQALQGWAERLLAR